MLTISGNEPKWLQSTSTYILGAYHMHVTRGARVDRYHYILLSTYTKPPTPTHTLLIPTHALYSTLESDRVDDGTWSLPYYGVAPTRKCYLIAMTSSAGISESKSKSKAKHSLLTYQLWTVLQQLRN